MKNLRETSQALATLRRDVQAYLEQFRGKRVLFLPNPGNGGDSLISAATMQAFARAGVDCTVIEVDAEVQGEIVFLGGGGNLIPLYGDIRTAFQRFLGRARKIVLLPHTVRGNEELLRELDGNCILFVRDRESLLHVQRVNSAVDVRLAHDMAFHLDAKAFLEDQSLISPGSALLQTKLASVGHSLDALHAWPSVDMLRLDQESTSDAPESDVDISDLFMLGVGPHEGPLAAWCFLRSIAGARHINTDRLHVGIGSALLGVPCTLRDNSYGKNAAVFRQSLQGFSNLRFIARRPEKASHARSLARADELAAQLEARQGELSRMAAALSDAYLDNKRFRAELAECGCRSKTARAALLAAERNIAALELERELSRQVHAELLARCETLVSAIATLRALVARSDSVQAEAARLREMHGRLALDHARQDEALSAAVNELASLRSNLLAQEERIREQLASWSWWVTQPLRWIRRKP